MSAERSLILRTPDKEHYALGLPHRGETDRGCRTRLTCRSAVGGVWLSAPRIRRPCDVQLTRPCLLPITVHIFSTPPLSDAQPCGLQAAPCRCIFSGCRSQVKGTAGRDLKAFAVRIPSYHCKPLRVSIAFRQSRLCLPSSPVRLCSRPFSLIFAALRLPPGSQSPLPLAFAGQHWSGATPYPGPALRSTGDDIRFLL